MPNLVDLRKAYTFDDLMLVPQHSEIKSRRDPSLESNAGRTKLSTPVFASPMNTVTEAEMVRCMAELGGAAVLHRYMSIEAAVDVVKELMYWGTIDGMGFDADVEAALWVAVGANGDTEKRIAALAAEGVRRFCVDVANGHSVHCLQAVELVKKIVPDAIVLAGNVCTTDGALRLAEAGTDLIRVGIGPGSVCTTRVVTGHGVPQLTAIEDCVKAKMGRDIGIVADGGIRSSGDIVKALAMGADFVMLGGLLAGTSDTPGETHKDPETGTLYKYYHGMASEAGRSHGGWFDRAKTAYVPEGESTKAPYKGETHRVIDQLMGGVRVGMSYTGAGDLAELRTRARWVEVTAAGTHEGTPHGKR